MYTSTPTSPPDSTRTSNTAKTPTSLTTTAPPQLSARRRWRATIVIDRYKKEDEIVVKTSCLP